MTASESASAAIARVLDKVVESGRVGHFRLATKGQAVRWRQEAYMMRKERKLRDGWTPYDNLRLVIDKAEPCVVTIKTGAMDGVLTLANEAIDPAPPDPYVRDMVAAIKLDPIVEGVLARSRKKAEDEKERIATKEERK